MDPSTRSKVERLVKGDEEVLSEMLSEIDPDGSIKELMSSLKDPAKFSDPDFLAEMQQKLLQNSEMADFAEKFLAENPDMAAELSGAGLNLGEFGSKSNTRL